MSDSASFISLTNPAALREGTEPERYGLPAFDSSTKIQGGAAGEGSYYIYGYSEIYNEDGPDKIVPWIAKAIPGTGSFTLGPKTELTDASLGLEPDGVYLDTFAITDMKVQDGKVFVLFKQTCADSDYELFIQRGGLLVFNDTGTGFVYERTVGLSSIKSQNFQKQVISSDGPLFKDTNGTPWIENLQVFLGFPYKSELDRFFCVPQKFVATKPKRLAIADQGSFVYFDGNGELASDVSSRIVEIDLETFSFSNTTVDGMKFNTRGNFAIEQGWDMSELDFTLYYLGGSGYSSSFTGTSYVSIECGSIPYYE